MSELMNKNTDISDEDVPKNRHKIPPLFFMSVGVILYAIFPPFMTIRKEERDFYILDFKDESSLK